MPDDAMLCCCRRQMLLMIDAADADAAGYACQDAMPRQLFFAPLPLRRLRCRRDAATHG